MFGKLTLVLAIGAAVLQAPISAPAAPCCSHLESRQASLSDECCAVVACGVISGDTAEQPITPAPASSELSAFPAPVCLVSLIEFPTRPKGARFAKAQPVAHAPPPLALLCTYLI